MVECDDETAELHMAMAEIMGEDEGDANVEKWPMDELNVMQFTTAKENIYGKKDQMYNLSINDFSYYFTSFYNNQISEKAIDNIASNLMEVVVSTWFGQR